MLRILIMMAVTVLTAYIALLYVSEGLFLIAMVEAAFLVLALCGLLLRVFSVYASLELPVEICEAGRANLIKITLQNRSVFPVTRSKAKVVIRDVFRNRKESRWYTLPPAGTGESVFIRDIAFYYTGSYEVELKKVRLYDMTGLLYMSISGKSRKQIRVLPKLHDVSVHLTESTKNFYGESDVYDEHTAGQDNSELFRVRQYQPGDRLQNVHWKLSAKQDEWMVKEHGMPNACPIVLFLEFNPKNKREQSRTIIPYLEAAASLSFSMMDAGCAHYVVWHDSADGDVKRLRIDDEESFFCLMNTLLKQKWNRYEEELLWRYQDKFRSEPYTGALFLDEKLQLKKDGELLKKLSRKWVEDSLREIELLL